MKLNRESLSKLLPAFTKRFNPQPNKSGERSRPPAQENISVDRRRPRVAPAPSAVIAQGSAPLPATTLPKPTLAPPNSLELMNSAIKFLRQHLICEDYQLTLLALWIIHTWCFRSFPTTAYLQIRSAESQSAKTLCIRILTALCDSPLLLPGAHWRSVMENLLTPDRRVVPGKPLTCAPPNTILLDECHHTFAPSERQHVLGLLNTGSQADCNYVEGLKQYCVFSPKAFAGNARLPRSLASRCIPIVLRRKKPSDVIARFNGDAVASAARLAGSFQSWVAANAASLAKIGQQAPVRVPVGLSARQQDCAEPLLHVAELIGGPWPEKARAAFMVAFNLADEGLAVELLADIRAIFFLKEDPSYLSTQDLLTALVGIEDRPWAAWRNDSGSARRLSNLLCPLGVRSKNFTKGSSSTFKGYLREAFLDPWERYLPPIPADWPETRARMKKEAEAQATTKN